MKRISVVTAGNPGLRNAGMLSVDLAFIDLCRNLNPEVSIEWLTPYNGEMVKINSRPYVVESELPFKSKIIRSNCDDLLESDLIVFWGDFLQARHYISDEAAPRLISAGVASSHQDAMNQLGSILLLSDAPDHVLEKTIIAGSTILMNRQSDYLDSQYGPAFLRLISKAKGVWMRDAISSAKVAQIRNGGFEVEQGIDCALFLTDETIDSMPRTEWSNGVGDKEKIGIFLGGRTNLPSGPIINFLRDISKQSNCDLDWLPWFGFDYPSYVKATDIITNPKGLLNYNLNRKKIKSHMRSDIQHTMGDLLYALNKYKFVITDTYHVCVNSWRAGTPAICISSSNPVSSSALDSLSLTDYKKLTLYSMYDALDYYVESDDILDRVRRKKRASVLLKTMNNNTVSGEIGKRIQQHCEAVRSTISAKMREVLGQT